MSTLSLRRLRDNPHIRELSRTVTINPLQMIQPLFVVEGIHDKEEIPGIPGTYRDTPDSLLTQVAADLDSGVRKFMLFGVGEHTAQHNFNYDFTVNNIKALKEKFGDQIWLAVDVCLCSSTNHGHCGILSENGDHVDNVQSVEALVKQALEFAAAGADCIAPSDMMDGRIGAIRQALDQEGYERVVLLSYAAKFASKFYGPFRVACDSAPDLNITLQDRKTYQIDPLNRRDSLHSVMRDFDEGADMVMVKPATHYLDIIRDVADISPVPVAAYYVSGEHALVECSAEKGLISSAREGHIEAWGSIRRAGADIIITYAARYAREWLEA